MPIPIEIVVANSFLMSSYILAPKNSLISTDAPMQIPLIPSISIFTIGSDVPTAANAFVPANLPTIIESTALKIGQYDYIYCLWSYL